MYCIPTSPSREYFDEHDLAITSLVSSENVAGRISDNCRSYGRCTLMMPPGREVFRGWEALGGYSGAQNKIETRGRPGERFSSVSSNSDSEIAELEFECECRGVGFTLARCWLNASEPVGRAFVYSV